MVLKALKNINFSEELIAYFPLIRHERHRKRHVQQFFFVSCNRCRGNVFTESLPSNGRIHIQTQRIIEEIMKYATAVGSGSTIYIPRFITTGSAIQKPTGVGGYTDPQAAWRSHKHTFIFSKQAK
jgi:hypothetical protein